MRLVPDGSSNRCWADESHTRGALLLSVSHIMLSDVRAQTISVISQCLLQALHVNYQLIVSSSSVIVSPPQSQMCSVFACLTLAFKEIFETPLETPLMAGGAVLIPVSASRPRSSQHRHGFSVCLSVGSGTTPMRPLGPPRVEVPLLKRFPTALQGQECSPSAMLRKAMSLLPASTLQFGPRAKNPEVKDKETPCRGQRQGNASSSEQRAHMISAPTRAIATATTIRQLQGTHASNHLVDRGITESSGIEFVSITVSPLEKACEA